MVHPRQCICDQCMAEYGTFKFYNQILQASAVGDQRDIPGVNWHDIGGN